MKKGYTGIDYFRVIAAVLVIAIHTSPLLSYNEAADFVLTRIIARVAVPFFFMTTGFFLFHGGKVSCQKIKRFTKKTAILYGISILLYLPINIYNGYFAGESLAGRIVRDFLFDGTMYHLWYLPASILGVWISAVLLRKVGMQKTLIAAGVLYVIGVFGDSYYGIAEQIPFIKGMYDVLFRIFSYTRNGLFFAPIFLVMGTWISCMRRQNAKRYLIPFLISVEVLVIEGMCLRIYKLQRHDSMYLFLIPCMFFLFQMLTYFRGKRKEALGEIALYVYILHPLVIVGLRLVAKIVKAEQFLIKNSLVQFVSVTVLSFVAAIIIEKIKKQYKGEWKR